VEYQGMQAVISIPDGKLLEGELPAKKLKFETKGHPLCFT
jgi:hypothetical protein